MSSPRVVYSLRLSPTDGRKLLAQIEAQRPATFATLTPGEREELTEAPAGFVHMDLAFARKAIGHRLETTADLARLVRGMQKMFPSVRGWKNGIAGGGFIINAPM